MPVEVDCVNALFVSEGPPAQPYFYPAPTGPYPFYPILKVRSLHDFAYKGNVDIDAWVDMQHETANDWYEHMDAFDDEAENFDDVPWNGLEDDAAIAQLMAGLQG